MRSLTDSAVGAQSVEHTEKVFHLTLDFLIPVGWHSHARAHTHPPNAPAHPMQSACRMCEGYQRILKYPLHLKVRIVRIRVFCGVASVDVCAYTLYRSF
jgi:hypothetical protein